PLKVVVSREVSLRDLEGRRRWLLVDASERRPDPCRFGIGLIAGLQVIQERIDLGFDLFPLLITELDPAFRLGEVRLRDSLEPKFFNEPQAGFRLGKLEKSVQDFAEKSALFECQLHASGRFLSSLPRLSAGLRRIPLYPREVSRQGHSCITLRTSTMG